MSRNGTTTVVFDVGNVLIQWNPRHLYRKIFLDEAGKADLPRMERFLAEVCTQTWNERQDAGRSLAAGTAELVARFPGQAAEIEAFYGRFQEMMPGPVEGTVEILRALKDRGLRLYGLSNFTRETFPETRARFGFLALLEGIVVSGEEGVIKPDRRIYERLLERYGLRAADCFFIDDSLSNVTAARALGFTAHHFRGAAGLADALRREGLLPDRGDGND